MYFLFKVSTKSFWEPSQKILSFEPTITDFLCIFCTSKNNIILFPLLKYVCLWLYSEPLSVLNKLKSTFWFIYSLQNNLFVHFGSLALGSLHQRSQSGGHERIEEVRIPTHLLQKQVNRETCLGLRGEWEYHSYSPLKCCLCVRGRNEEEISLIMSNH